MLINLSENFIFKDLFSFTEIFDINSNSIIATTVFIMYIIFGYYY